MKNLSTLYLISGALTIWTAMSVTVFLLWHFFQISRFDIYSISEPDLVILYAEIVLFFVLGANSVLFLVLTIIKIKKHRAEVSHDNG